MKKILLIALAVILFIAIGLFVLSFINSSPLNQKEAREMIKQLLTSELEQNKNLNGLLVHIEANKKNFKESFNLGTVHGANLNKDQPYHVASVGKIFTAALIMHLRDQTLLSLNDSIVKHLDSSVYEKLFIIDGKDYSQEVTIRHLLTHTSGVADYFDGPVIQGEKLVTQLITKPDIFYTPLDLIKHTADNQVPVAEPGKKFQYSDTGYILLGLISESVTKQPFHVNLKQIIFDPLEMKNSYLHFYSEPLNNKKEISELWVNGTEIHDYQSVSMDWSGGGIISTLKDLGIFIKALFKGKILKKSTVKEMMAFDHQFTSGIYYGQGMMEFRFGDFFPLLANLPLMHGHMGITGTLMLYNQNEDILYVCNYGNNKYIQKSIINLIEIMSLIQRIKVNG